MELSAHKRSLQIPLKVEDGKVIVINPDNSKIEVDAFTFVQVWDRWTEIVRNLACK